MLYARSFSDVYDAWYNELDDPTHVVAAFGRRCDPGAVVVEFGGGTGRLAMPLNTAGFATISLDVSFEMLAAAKPGPERVVGDMTHVGLAASCADGVLIAYNTLFNLASRASQRACFAEAARLLSAGGWLGIEGFVAPSGLDTFGVTTKPHPTDPDAQLAIVTGPDPVDPDVIVGSHIEMRLSGATCRPWRLTYQSPEALDECAAAAGLECTDRFGDWDGSPFTSTHARHVSWYQKI